MNSDRIKPLDGLRAVAVLAVIVQHSWTSLPPQITVVFELTRLGPDGVRLFFVLSGFLITGILLNARRDAEAHSQGVGSVFAAFYARRALRIFPCAYVAMLVGWLIGLPAMREHGIWYLGYVGNWPIAVPGLQFDARGIGHFWSLAIEEQFYLFWPALVLLVPLKRLKPVLYGLIAVAVVTRFLAIALTPSETRGYGMAYILTPCRLDALSFGALAALSGFKLRRLLAAGTAFVVAGVLLPKGALWADMNEIGGVLLSTAIVLGVVQGYGASVLGSRPFVYIGTISYGLYVWHYLLPDVFAFIGMPRAEWRIPQLGPAGLVLPNFIASMIVASISWFVLERPLNSLKRFFPYGRRPLTRANTAVATA